MPSKYYESSKRASIAYQQRHRDLGLCILCPEPSRPKVRGPGLMMLCERHYRDRLRRGRERRASQ